MAIQSIEDSKQLRSYCAKLGRKGVALRIIELANDIVNGAKAGGHGPYQSTLHQAGMIRALCVGAKCDDYWHEKQQIGFNQMLCEAKYDRDQRKDLFESNMDKVTPE